MSNWLKAIMQAYFFTDFSATTETGISETLSLGGKFLSLAKKSLSLSKKALEFREKEILELYMSAENSKSPVNRTTFYLIKNWKLQL